MKKIVVVGLLGTTLDRSGRDRWEHWRPSIDLCRHDDLVIDRFELLHQSQFQSLADSVIEDIRHISPETNARSQLIEFRNPWDFEEVYGVLHDFARAYPWRPASEDYLVHMTTGTHVGQICLFLLTESRHLPARLIQASPPKRGGQNHPGSYTIIDLDLSKYDRIASRFRQQQREGTSFLKAGINTRNRAFNHLIERIEQVAVGSKAPLLLMGPTGSGKSQLARRIYDLKKTRGQVGGPFVEINCATLRGDAAMSALFGHVKGAFTGALRDRAGLLRSANTGVLFLDEIGELGIDEQAMLLRAIEDKVFLPVGADDETRSDFQLLAGTNRDLGVAVRERRFREDLLARINVWTFRLPGLRERPEDIEPNLEFEIEQCAAAIGVLPRFSSEARQTFVKFATSSEAHWLANFRDFNAAVVRMATLAAGGRIDVALVREEIERLRGAWRSPETVDDGTSILARHLSPDAMARLDRFDRAQLADVLSVCERSVSLSDAGRRLFAVSRGRKSSSNDADRLRKYLARFDLSWGGVRGVESASQVAEGRPRRKQG